MTAGRPPIPEDEVKKWQELYLDLLAEGKTEVEVNAVEGMPCWFTRYHWRQNDSEFSTRRGAAQRQGVEKMLHDAQYKLQDTYLRAIDEAASPQLVAIVDKIAQHARWKATKLNREDYGEKTDVTSDGKAIKGTIVVASTTDKELLESI